MNRPLAVRTLMAAVLSLCVSTAWAALNPAPPALIPEPREFAARTAVPLFRGVQIIAPGADADWRFAAEDLKLELAARGVRLRDGATSRVYLLHDDSTLARTLLRREGAAFTAAMQPEGYVLLTRRNEVYVIAHSGAGAFYGVQTLKQLVSAGASGPVFRGAAIRDWPAMRWRGVHDDLSRGPAAGAVQRRGLGPVYIDFLTAIHQALAPLHRRLLFWGDVAMTRPDLVSTLPHDMIAVPWHYQPEPQGFTHWLDPYTQAGMETWVSPGVNNWDRLWPDFNLALANIQGFVADGQKAGSTGMLNTIWNDDGEGLFLEDWYAVLFGAAAAWQPGACDIGTFAQDYGPVFHGDATGDINEAQRALMAAHSALSRAGLADARDEYFWIDPWSDAGQNIAAKLRPVATEVRLDAERALTLIAQARAAGALRQTDALDAMEVGARRIDFLAYHFQAADQIAGSYVRMYKGQNDPAVSIHVPRDLWNLSGVNGLCEDLRNGYDYLGMRYSEVWLKENRRYWLRNVTGRYDATAQLWMERGDKLEAARQQWILHRTLPSPETIGIPPSIAAQ